MSEFHVDLGAEMIGMAVESPPLQQVEDAICNVDPAAVIDFTPATARLRVAAALERNHLGRLLASAGCPVPTNAIVQLPSICCGGCSG